MLSASPQPGSVIHPDSLVRGLRVAVVVEHTVDRLPKGVAPFAVMLAQILVDPGPLPAKPGVDRGWLQIAERGGSRETMQHALEGTLLPPHVVDGRITLRVTVWFKDSTKVIWAPPTASTIIEYVVRGSP